MSESVASSVEAVPVAEQVLKPPTPHRDARRERGKTLRQKCPRSSHADLILGQTQRDPLALLEESNIDRMQSLLPIRFTRMLESSFAFFRGTAILQAHDLQGTPSAGISVHCCGDCHLMNFGGFATPERALVFDINDFDETHPGPFEWDIKRLAASFVVAARWLGFDPADARLSAETAVAEYRRSMTRFAEMSVLEIWYARITMDELLEKTADDPAIQKRIRKQMKRAYQNTSERVFEKITTTVDGIPQIAVQPPLLFHFEDHDEHMRTVVLPFFERYRDSLPRERRVLFDRYRVLDAAYKVVGVGSVGTRCFVVLLMDDQDDPLFLQVKEARTSVLAGRACASEFAHDGERVVTGQRLMQSASDIFLGWSTGPLGREYYVRQLRDMKFAPDLRDVNPRTLLGYARLCGETLARAHAKTGDAAAIAGYLGQAETFEKAIAGYAVGYADQVERDYEAFRIAARQGRFPTEIFPSDVEQAIR